MATVAVAPTISFSTELISLNGWTILHFPKQASAKLPSRGIVMVKGKINGHEFQTVLEPDGNWNHWFRLDAQLLHQINAKVGDEIHLEVEVTRDWYGPDLPTDIKKALATDAKANATWQKVTPMARWEWLRWIRSTSKNETRQRRIEVACSKLRSGMRRPCCFNSNMCTEMAVSKNGVLLDPSNT